MPIHGVFNDQNVIRLFVDSNREADSKTVTIADIRGAGEDSQAIANAMAELLQNDVDFVQKRSTLPSGDPDKNTNPNRPDLFWRGGDLVGRAITVSIEWTGSEYVVGLDTTQPLRSSGST